MKKIMTALICCMLAVAACKKNDKTPYDKDITGLQLRDIDAVPAGVLGTLDTKTTSDTFFMAIFPTPCLNLMDVAIDINNSVPVTLTASLVYVRYPGAPDGTVVENKDLAGTVAQTQVKHLGIASSQPPAGTNGQQQVIFSFDVSSLPQGFYRVYIESDKGDRYWDNGWIKR